MCQVEQTRPLRNAGLRNAEGMPFRSLYRSLFDSCIYFPYSEYLKICVVVVVVVVVVVFYSNTFAVELLGLCKVYALL